MQNMSNLKKVPIKMRPVARSKNSMEGKVNRKGDNSSNHSWIRK